MSILCCSCNNTFLQHKVFSMIASHCCCSRTPSSGLAHLTRGLQLLQDDITHLDLLLDGLATKGILHNGFTHLS